MAHNGHYVYLTSFTPHIPLWHIELNDMRHLSIKLLNPFNMPFFAQFGHLLGARFAVCDIPAAPQASERGRAPPCCRRHHIRRRRIASRCRDRVGVHPRADPRFYVCRLHIPRHSTASQARPHQTRYNAPGPRRSPGRANGHLCRRPCGCARRWCTSFREERNLVQQYRQFNG